MDQQLRYHFLSFSNTILHTTSVVSRLSLISQQVNNLYKPQSDKPLVVHQIGIYKGSLAAAKYIATSTKHLLFSRPFIWSFTWIPPEKLISISKPNTFFLQPSFLAERGKAQDCAHSYNQINAMKLLLNNCSKDWQSQLLKGDIWLETFRNTLRWSLKAESA